MSRSRLELRDELLRLVQLVDPAPEIRRLVPRILSHRWYDPMRGLLVDAVGRLVDDPMARRDGSLAYRLADVRAAGDLLALLFEGFELVARFDRRGRLVSVVDDAAFSSRTQRRFERAS